MARPKAEINPDDVLYLAGIGCKNTEIAIKLGCSPDTLERRFAGELALGKVNLKIRLRELQFQMARKNPNMQIWLGKQYLDQTDKEKPSDDKPTEDVVYEANIGTYSKEAS